ncbi:uncharacterized protein B0P05DRAFT_528466 [Gilbertella persicaria]|uniref:uncharacterized protein n=1 Tax=Gilbertella persicaria TaxID=101096 RepID=UPI00221E7FD9|nr:uncharacterized protein B0P05DRAFT_528466 [Gilbertella persicaria]KAI8091031.1 hypothetical protein B0P05DRAFT_528466 [Gilbertella persicaria]
MLAFRKKKSSAVGPVTQQEKPNVLITRKVSYAQAKKLWHQLLTHKRMTKTATILFDSHEHLSPPPTPPPKKSQTMPDLVGYTDHWMDRALPHLPYEEEKHTSSLSRTSTWVGKSIQRWISTYSSSVSSSSLMSAASSTKRSLFGKSGEIFMGKSGPLLLDHSELHEEELEDATRHSFSSSLSPNYLADKMTLHSKVLQVTSLGSSGSYQYQMDIRVTNNPVQTHHGIMRKAAKEQSMCHPRTALTFHVQGRFQIECCLTLKPYKSTHTLMKRLKSLKSKSDLFRLANMEQGEEQRVEEKKKEEEEEEEEVEEETIQARLVLDSGEELLSSFANRGISRYTLQTSSSVTIELTMVFLLETLEEDDEDEDEEKALYTPIDQDVLNYCVSGDYLTFYVKGEYHPTWNRYWVTFESHQLVLRLNERGKGEPVTRFPLKELNQVNINPSEDTLEEIYLGKKHGMILTFGKYSMFLFADNHASMRYWKCLLEQYANAYIHSISKIHKKYLWPSSVAQ